MWFGGSSVSSLVVDPSRITLTTDGKSIIGKLHRRVMFQRRYGRFSINQSETQSSFSAPRSFELRFKTQPPPIESQFVLSIDGRHAVWRFVSDPKDHLSKNYGESRRQVLFEEIATARWVPIGRSLQKSDKNTTKLPLRTVLRQPALLPSPFLRRGIKGRKRLFQLLKIARQKARSTLPAPFTTALARPCACGRMCSA